MAPLRCHLLIGQPASGKTTLAHTLRPLLSGPGEPPAVVLSTDAIRAEVFGDAAQQASGCGSGDGEPAAGGWPPGRQGGGDVGGDRNAGGD
ncbi:MAG: hypothetical protein EA413_01105 [Cyanobium sp. PLM2.Bin73]|nr:MAG: hypothetical protein EA413_01105 [Cyanobium sp. PLM2.Bin73]